MRRPQRKKLKILPKAIIVCEGKVTEVIYFEGVRITRRIPTSRVIIHSAAGKPKQIVDKAVTLRKENDAQNKSQGLEVTDTVWAVFDAGGIDLPCTLFLLTSQRTSRSPNPSRTRRQSRKAHI